MQPSPARDVNIASTEALISPVGLVEELPLTPDVEAVVLEGRRQIQAVLRGEDPRFLVITGPCSVHDEEAGLEYAHRLKALQDEYSDRMLIVMRVYFEKPRTTVGWEGHDLRPLPQRYLRHRRGVATRPTAADEDWRDGHIHGD